MNILIIAQYSLTREGLVRLLDDPAFRFTRAAHVHQVEEGGHWDVALMDCPGQMEIWLPEIALLHQRFPALPIGLLVERIRLEDVRRAITSGASGFVDKNGSVPALKSVTALIASGEVFVPSWVMRSQNGDLNGQERHSPLSALTRRQRQVLSLMVAGLSNAAIARELHIGPSTVRNHVQSILKSLNVHSRTQAVLAAVRAGLYPAPSPTAPLSAEGEGLEGRPATQNSHTDNGGDVDQTEMGEDNLNISMR